MTLLVQQKLLYRAEQEKIIPSVQPTTQEMKL